MPGKASPGVLGAILAGGQGTRFGDDKLLAQVHGISLLEWTKSALAEQVEEIVVCGREDPACPSLEDFPGRFLGPLGGLCAALRYAEANAYQHVLSVPADSHPIPRNLVDVLEGQHARVLQNQWLIGWWPAQMAGAMETYLRAGHRSVRGWLDIANPERIGDASFDLVNINEPQDLNKLRSRMEVEYHDYRR